MDYSRAGASAATACVALGLLCPLARAQDDRPNIVFLFTDDQRFDALGFMHPVLETPTLDQLAEHGALFRQAFVTTPICPSSRATVLTGVHERTHGFTFGKPPIADWLLAQSYPKLLRDAGYVTGFVGKNGAKLSSEKLDELFDEHVSVTRAPYFQVRENELSHATDYTGKKAVEFVRAHAGSSRFMLTVWFNAPHADDNDPAQFVPPKGLERLYQGVDHPEPPTSSPRFFAELPPFLQQSFNRVRWSQRWSPDRYDSMMSRYLAMIAGVDRAVKAILTELHAQSVADRTVIVFMSDNGYFVGERGFGGKWLAYEPSIRVPLIIHDPRSATRPRIDELVLNIDLPPTFLELAGVDVPEVYQGRSLAPLLRGEVSSWRRDFFIEHSHAKSAVEIPRHESLRTARLKYTHYLDHDREELYDLACDPFEARDLAQEPDWQGELAATRERTLTLRDSYPRAGVSDQPR